MSMLVASYGLVLVGSYLVGFVLLVIVYWKILKLIQRMRKSLGESLKLVELEAFWVVSIVCWQWYAWQWWMGC